MQIFKFGVSLRRAEILKIGGCEYGIIPKALFTQGNISARQQTAGIR
jgi:hypothetical protein